MQYSHFFSAFVLVDFRRILLTHALALFRSITASRGPVVSWHNSFIRCSFRVQNKAERLSRVDPGISREGSHRPVTRVCATCNARDRSITRRLQTCVLIETRFG